jgi:hypothetical protein
MAAISFWLGEGLVEVTGDSVVRDGYGRCAETIDEAKPKKRQGQARPAKDLDEELASVNASWSAHWHNFTSSAAGIRHEREQPGIPSFYRATLNSECIDRALGVLGLLLVYTSSALSHLESFVCFLQTWCWPSRSPTRDHVEGNPTSWTMARHTARSLDAQRPGRDSASHRGPLFVVGKPILTPAQVLVAPP